jgi:hypothetical protein
MLELLSAILVAADNTFMEQESLSLFPGEYMDGTIAPPDITEVEIEIDRMYTVESGLPGLRVQVSTHEHGGFIAYLQTDDEGIFDDMGTTTTLEGYCKQNCDCPMCDAMRSQDEYAAWVAL